MTRMTRDEALALLHEYVKSPALISHCKGVEAALRAYAPRYGGEPDLWGLAGLLHDFYWEIHPDAARHPPPRKPILEERGVPHEGIYALPSHAPYPHIPPPPPPARA